MRNCNPVGNSLLLRGSVPQWLALLQYVPLEIGGVERRVSKLSDRKTGLARST